MKALDIFKAHNKTVNGKILSCSKGGYTDDTFAYCISDVGNAINVVVISDVNPREYSVEKPAGAIYLQDIITAILYNEWKARVIHNNSMALSV